mmetsp:Transcript_103967/g.224420  ORF Transcript_103967/g.224420 Transcript_103967/m.224420 type:complete len:224 (-) Transcript_103967:121-792(-)
MPSQSSDQDMIRPCLLWRFRFARSAEACCFGMCSATSRERAQSKVRQSWRGSTRLTSCTLPPLSSAHLGVPSKAKPVTRPLSLSHRLYCPPPAPKSPTVTGSASSYAGFHTCRSRARSRPLSKAHWLKVILRRYSNDLNMPPLSWWCERLVAASCCRLASSWPLRSSMATACVRISLCCSNHLCRPDAHMLPKIKFSDQVVVGGPEASAAPDSFPSFQEVTSP